MTPAIALSGPGTALCLELQPVLLTAGAALDLERISHLVNHFSLKKINERVTQTVGFTHSNSAAKPGMPKSGGA